LRICFWSPQLALSLGLLLARQWCQLCHWRAGVSEVCLRCVFCLHVNGVNSATGEQVCKYMYANTHSHTHQIQRPRHPYIYTHTHTHPHTPHTHTHIRFSAPVTYIYIYTHTHTHTSNEYQSVFEKIASQLHHKNKKLKTIYRAFPLIHVFSI
jgi:hypothetical protein